MRPSATLRYGVVMLLPLGPLVHGWQVAAGTASAASAWMPVLMVHLLVPLLDLWIGEDDFAPVDDPGRGRIARWLPLLCLPAWFALLAGSAWLAQSMDGLAWWGMAVSTGVVGGLLAINPAHELIHRNTRLERAAGGLLLAGVAYGAFKIEHVRGHHAWVATERDTASARLGESVYPFVLRSMRGTVLNAWRLEQARLARLGAAWWRSQWWLWNGLTLLIATALALAFGWQALGLFAAASLVAVFELEIINYIEHYGLARRRAADGRYEPVSACHSWNANTAVVNAFLFNLQRHSDHHAHAGKDYLALRSEPQAPQLPWGYGAMVLLALVPPLWRRVMDHRVIGLGQPQRA
ncbi:MAG: alkane 1-monooxygenase [Burkholderiales bacterium]|nr:MAG: alkane 1-monooxygenase [Burkholderiales bacterium]